MKLSSLQKRAERRGRNQTTLDMNLVSLIDVFTILIFFLLSSSGGVEVLANPKSVRLPESTAQAVPRDTLVVVVNNADILVEGRRIATVAEVMAQPGDLIAPLEAELKALAGRRLIRPENQAQSQAVTIMGDKDIPYQLLRKVMATAARADFTDVAFAVHKRDES